MALLTFPLALDQFFMNLPIAQQSFYPPEALDVAETAGGEVLTADIGVSLWTGQIDLGPMTHDESGAVLPLLNLLKRAASSFLVSDTRRPWPRLDPHGLLLGSATPMILAVGTSMRELAFKSLPAGYQLSRGDLVSFQYGVTPVRYALHELVGSAVANTAGETSLIEVTPPLRPGADAGQPVQLLWPRCKARLVPGSIDAGTSSASITRDCSFRWSQTLR